jgi:uncharacterized protein (TIGR04141 family)
MKKGYVLLNAFRLYDTMDGKEIETFDEFLIDDPGPLKTYDLSNEFSFKARLYVSEKEEKEPAWVPYLRNGFINLPKLTNIIINRALMIIGIKFRNKVIHFALSFGFGRYLLKSSSYIRNYGLIVALNAIYKGDPKKGIIDPNLIQSLDIKTISANTMHTRRQSNRKATFEMFGVDIQRDILRSITGRPSEETEWGTRISGSDALTVNCPVDFKDLGERCGWIETLYRKTNYKDYFSWIDNIKVVTDPHLKEDLESDLLAKLKKKEAGNMELAPPEIVDWDRIKSFRFSFDPGQPYEELELDHFLAALESKDKLEGLSIKQLKITYRIEALDNNDEPVGNWNALQCLCGELSYNKQTYILEGNDFFAVDDTYRKDVDKYIDEIKEYKGQFPKCEADWYEDDFNTKAGEQKEYLLLHKQPVRLPEKTTPIEICDLLSADRCFIHVKPKFSSSELSHLFSQGYISGELFYTSPDFRRATLKAITKAMKAKTKGASSASTLADKFATFEAGSINPWDYKVVYTIIGNWDGKGFKDKLPFFSKLNLRKFAHDLRSMGFEVLCKRIQKP